MYHIHNSVPTWIYCTSPFNPSFSKQHYSPSPNTPHHRPISSLVYQLSDLHSQFLSIFQTLLLDQGCLLSGSWNIFLSIKIFSSNIQKKKKLETFILVINKILILYIIWREAENHPFLPDLCTILSLSISSSIYLE